MRFCTSCGKEITGTPKFCEACGAPANLPADAAPPPVSPGISLPQPPSPSPPPSPPAGAPQPGRNTKLLIAAIAALILVAAIWVVASPQFRPGTGTGAPVSTPAITPTAISGTSVPTQPPVTTVPTTVPEPFPDALAIREWFRYNEGKYASQATVYRYWINETYQWHNDMDNHWYTEPQRPDPNNKYLLVYVAILNTGTSAYPYPKSNMIFVHSNGQIYTVDTSHYIPDKAGNRKATPIEIREIQQQPDLFNSEFVEDYGYSHGTTSDFIYPGQSNAIDGYLIYKVPASLVPEKTYVEIVFDGEDKAVWKLG